MSIPAPPQLEPLAKIRETPQAVWYRARQTRLGREVLLKMRRLEPRLPGGADDGVRARAREEMLLLSRVHCDGVAAAIDVGEVEGWAYQVVELPPGDPLTRCFQKRGRAPWSTAEALAIAERLAGILEELHRSGICVRRLHPEDVFLATDGRVKLASLEWAAGPGADPSLPPDIPWLAPELSGHSKCAPPADVFALGLVLTWLLTGREPAASGLRRADEKALEALRTRGTPAPIVDLVSRLLEADPALRPAGGTEARAAFEALRGKPAGRSRLRLALILSAAVLLAAAAAWMLFDGGAGGPKRLADRRQNLEKPAEPKPPEAGATDAAGVDPDAARPAETEDPPPAETEPPASAKPADSLAGAEKTQEKALEKESAKEKEKEERAARAKGREAVEEFASRERAALLAAGDFRTLAARLDGLAKQFPFEGERLAALRREMGSSEAEAIDRLREEAAALLAANDFEGAGKRIAKGTARLASPRKQEVESELRERLQAAKAGRAEAAARVDVAARRARELGGALSLDEARSVLESVDAPADLTAALDPLRRLISEAIAARQTLGAGLDRAISQKLAFRARIYDAEGKLGEPDTFVIDERRGEALVAHRRGFTARFPLSAFDLEPEALEKLAGPADDAHARREGLLILYAGAGRPEAAGGLVDGGAASATGEGELKIWLDEARARRLQVFASEAARRRDELTARKAAAADWTALKSSIAGRLRGAAAGESSVPSQSPARTELEAIFLAITKESLKARVPEGLFHGQAQKDRRDGSLKLVYDFRDAVQNQDWTAFGNNPRIARSGGAVVLTGAMRLASGNPFAGRLRAVVGLPAGGYPVPPRLGVILASREPTAPGKEGPGGKPKFQPAGGGSATRPLNGERPVGDPPPPPAGDKPDPAPAAVPAAGSLAFVIGQETLSKSIDVPGESVPLSVPSPANVLFLTAGALPALHEVAAAVPSGRFQGPLLLTAEMGSGHFQWLLNGKPALPPAADAAVRKLARQGELEKPIGSVTIFADGDPVTIEAVEIFGFLDESWVEARLSELAQRELSEIYPRPAASPRAGAPAPEPGPAAPPGGRAK